MLDATNMLAVPDLSQPAGWLPLVFALVMALAMLAYVILDGRASVLYTDYFARPPARWHRHRTRQLLTVGASGHVVRIENEELPGEREALQAYLTETGTKA